MKLSLDAQQQTALPDNRVCQVSRELCRLHAACQHTQQTRPAAAAHLACPAAASAHPSPPFPSCAAPAASGGMRQNSWRGMEQNSWRGMGQNSWQHEAKQLAGQQGIHTRAQGPHSRHPATAPRIMRSTAYRCRRADPCSAASSMPLQSAANGCNKLTAAAALALPACSFSHAAFSAARSGNRSFCAPKQMGAGAQ